MGNIFTNLTNENIALRQQIIMLQRNRKHAVLKERDQLLADLCAMRIRVETRFLD